MSPAAPGKDGPQAQGQGAHNNAMQIDCTVNVMDGHSIAASGIALNYKNRTFRICIKNPGPGPNFRLGEYLIDNPDDEYRLITT